MPPAGWSGTAPARTAQAGTQGRGPGVGSGAEAGTETEVNPGPGAAADEMQSSRQFGACLPWIDRLERVATEVLEESTGRSAVPGGVSGEDLVRLRRVVNRLEAAFSNAVRRFDIDNEWAGEGATSAAAWLRAHCRLSAAESHRRIKVGRALERMPATLRAFEAGEISYSHARVLASEVDERTEEAFRDVEESLVHVARQCSPAELRGVVEYWRTYLDDDKGAAAAEERYQQRRLHVSATFEGMVAIDGLLDPEGGEIVLTALQGLVDAGRETERASPHEQRRTAPQRRADALVEACRALLDGRVPVTRGGERPHITVVVSLEALAARTTPASSFGAGSAGLGSSVGSVGATELASLVGSVGAARLEDAVGATGLADAIGTSGPHGLLGSWDLIEALRTGRCEAAHLGPVSAETVRRWACDASISRVITGTRGEPLEAGRQRRTVTGAQRRALVVRDAGCRFPGCDRQPAWCAPHHLVHWADGGPTDLDNLLLLCHRHHRLVHEGRWEIGIDSEGQVRAQAPVAKARGPGGAVAA
ncbi:MAG: HNH endonuclease [Acidimicrobiia bacterium]|nr:HNH endonuclease [Acidimicrobiia bacterium]